MCWSVQVGVYTEGLSHAIDKLVGPNGVLTNRKSVLDLLSPRMKRSVNAQTKLDEFTDKVRH